MVSRKRSEIWLYFTPLNADKAKCLKCSAIISYKGGGTGNLRKHTITKHPSIDLNAERKTAREQVVSIDTVTFEEIPEPEPSTSTIVIMPIPEEKEEQVNDTKCPTTDRIELFNTKLMKMIAIDLHPFSIVEDEGFKQLIEFLDPSIEMPSTTTLSGTYLKELYESCKRKLEDLLLLSSDVTLTTDTWTSVSNKSFVALTAHFISQDWVSNECLLNCFEVGERHSKEDLKDLLIGEVNKWGLSSKVRAIVTDNDPSIVEAVKLTDWNHLPCFAHLFNLVVQESLPKISELQSKVRYIVEYFQHNTSASNELSKYQRNTSNSSLCLIMEVKTRWSSTLDMFQRFCQLYVPIKATLVILDDPVEMLQESEFEDLKEICDILKPFKEITLEMSADKNVTISKIMLIINLLNENIYKVKWTVSETNKLFAEHVQKNLMKRFGEVENNELFTHSAFLDPRFKDKAFKNENLLNTCKSELTAILKENAKDEMPISEIVKDEFEIVEEGSFWTDFDMTIQNSKQPPIPAYQIELRQFSDDPPIPRKSDPLLWWKSKEHTYPHLASLAKSVLGTVASSAPCGRIFSTEEDPLSTKRNRLDDETVAQLLFVNSILRIQN